MVDTATEQRLDVWLYRTRLLKSRSLATKLVSQKKLRLTRHHDTQRMSKPGFRVAIGDQASFMRGPALIQVEILGFPPRRGPAAEARQFYRLIPIQDCDSEDG